MLNNNNINKISDLHNKSEIEIFREYLRIQSVHPNIDYEPCVKFIEKQAINLNLPMHIYYPGCKTKPVIILTWLGSDPIESTIFLSSHMDVVPVFEDKWIYPPFDAHIDDDGRIYARGSQDMKCVGMQYLAAIRALKMDGIQQLKRTINICFTPDEEMGDLGMCAFVNTDDFKNLNIGFALDEGIAEPSEIYPIFYGERTAWSMNFVCNGTSGHGALLLKDTPGEKLFYLFNKFMELRKHAEQRLKDNPNLTIGEVTTVNITKLSGGVQSNVIPPSLIMSVDFRITPINENEQEIKDMINRWCTEAGGNIEITNSSLDKWSAITKLDDTNLFWIAFRKALVSDLGLQIKPLIFPAGTDASFLRNENIPAIGFSPLNNTPVLLHDNNEYITVDTYLKGIQIYKQILLNIANV